MGLLKTTMRAMMALTLLAPLAPLNAQEAGEGEGTPPEETKATHGSWQVRCTTAEPKQCFLYQLLLSDEKTPILEYTLVPVKDESDNKIVLGGTIVTPLNVVLGRGVIMQIDENDPVQEQYGWCAPIGCFSRFGITEQTVSAYKGGKQVYVVIFSMQDPGTGIELKVPLNGFTAAYNELMELEKG